MQWAVLSVAIVAERDLAAPASKQHPLTRKKAPQTP
jgi:hypothetical protein